MSGAATPATREPRAQRARDKVFAVAADLFYRKGVRAVGVETIVKQAGVTKISLYRSFPSKDDLALAYLEDRSQSFLRQWDDAFDRHRNDPRAQLHAIMVHLAERTTTDGYRGCPFINFCAEFPDPGHPGRGVARATKAELRVRFLRIAEALKVTVPQRLADSLLLLVEGAYAISQTLGGRDSPGFALTEAADALIRGWTSRSPLARPGDDPAARPLAGPADEQGHEPFHGKRPGRHDPEAERVGKSAQAR